MASSLYQQLLYNWERGFYSVVYATTFDEYAIFSTKSPSGLLRFSGLQKTVEQCKFHIGATWYEGNLDERWKIVDTIHPSELMGKGFQVGDKVLYEDEVCTVKRAGGSSRICIESDYTEYMVNTDELKPVLPLSSKADKDGYLPIRWHDKPEFEAEDTEEKKECEHEWEQMFWKEFLPDQSIYKTHPIPMWGCINKCGLVTCKNPNQE